MENFTDQPIFNSLSVDEKNLLQENSTVVRFDAKETLIKIDSFAVNSYLIMEGLCKVTFESGDKKCISGFLDTGVLTGMAYINQNTYPYSIHALSSVVTVVIPLTILRQLYHENLRFALDLSEYYNAKLEIAIHWFITLGFKNVEGAVAMLLLRFYKEETPYELQLSRQEMSDILNYSRESVINSLKGFESEGLIETQGKNITLLKPEKLEEIAKWG